jgi:hypothetical protein
MEHVEAASTGKLQTPKTYVVEFPHPTNNQQIQ